MNEKLRFLRTYRCYLLGIQEEFRETLCILIYCQILRGCSVLFTNRKLL